MNKTAWVFLAVVLLSGMVGWAYQEGLFDEWLHPRAAEEAAADKLPTAGQDGLVSEIPGLVDKAKAAADAQEAKLLPGLMAAHRRKELKLLDELGTAVTGGGGDCGQAAQAAQTKVDRELHGLDLASRELLARAARLPAAGQEAVRAGYRKALKAEEKGFTARVAASHEALKRFELICHAESEGLRPAFETLGQDRLNPPAP